MSGLPAGLWTELHTALEKKLGPERYNHLIRHARPLLLDDEEFVFGVENSNLKTKIDRAYHEVVTRCARAVTNRNVRVKFSVDERLFVPPVAVAAAPETVTGRFRRSEYAGGGFPMTFDAFIVGPGTQIAYKASQRFVETRGDLFSPLLLYGEPGVGKTHLLRSIANGLQALPKPPHIAFLTAGQFITQFALAVQNGQLASFRQKCRTPEILLLDDVQLLVHKERTQEELLHTMDALVGSGRRLALSCVSHPAELDGLSRALRMRLRSGMEARLEPPDYPSRLAFLRRHAAAGSSRLGDEILDPIARRVLTGMKDLLACYRTAADLEEITPRAVQEIVDQALRPWGGAVTLEDIAREVASSFGLKMADLTSRRRSQTVAQARKIAFHISRRLTRHSLEEIGRFFGGRDHSTVLLACRKVPAALAKDESVARLVVRLERELQKWGGGAAAQRAGG